MINKIDCTLRKLDEPDLDLVLKWRNSEQVRNNMFSSHIISYEEHRSWYKSVIEQKKSIYLIFEFQRKPVGLVYFNDINTESNRCFWGFYLGENSTVKGTGTAMGFCGLEYAFETLNIRKVCGEVLGFNANSIKFHKRLCFKEEGRFVEHILKDGKLVDIIYFSLFKKEWVENKECLKSYTFY